MTVQRHDDRDRQRRHDELADEIRGARFVLG